MPTPKPPDYYRQPTVSRCTWRDNTGIVHGYRITAANGHWVWIRPDEAVAISDRLVDLYENEKETSND